YVCLGLITATRKLPPEIPPDSACYLAALDHWYPIPPEGRTQRRRTCSVIVVFALVANGKDGHALVALYLVQGHVTGCTERHQQLAQERVVRVGLAAGEGKQAQQPHRLVDGIQRPLRHLQILFQQEAVQPPQIVARRPRVADVPGHDLAL